MRNLKFIDILKIATGKVFTGSDFWLYKRYDNVCTGHKNNPRDYQAKPVTDEERKTQQRMALMAPAYRALKASPDEWREFLAEYNEQRKTKHGIKTNPYAYFVRREMAKMKAEGELAADPSKNKQDWSLKHR